MYVCSIKNTLPNSKHMDMKKTALITGASSGIGQATATRYAEAGYRLILCGRRAERLEQLKNQLQSQYQNDILLLSFDIRERAQVAHVFDSLSEDWKNIDILVNNAGLASGLEPIQDGTIDDWDLMIDTNVKGLLYVSKAVMPLMIARKQGHIINIDSTAGKEVYPNGNVYCASKHAVDAISKAMRIDLVSHGIKVTNLCPGMVETEFSIVRFHGDNGKAEKVYQGFDVLQAKDIADTIYYLSSLPKHVCINDLVITCTAQANSTTVHKEL